MEEPLSIRPATPADAEVIVNFNLQMALESEGLRLEPASLRFGVLASLENPDRDPKCGAHIIEGLPWWRRRE